MATSSSSLQVTPSVAFTEYTELNFQRLYLYHTHSGPKTNQAGITHNASIGIGATVVNNWEVYDGPGENAELVARAQGFHMQAGKWVNCFSLVFVDERFYGSTLEVMGVVVETGEWAVVGGTGQFAMANGVITKKTHEARRDGNIIELTIRAFCPQLKGATTRPNRTIHTQYPVIKIGPWGGSGGSPMDITEAPSRLQSIIVCAGLVVDSIAFSYLDYNGQKRSTGRWGSSGGDSHKIKLGKSELITEVSGTAGTFSGATVITSIKFVTNLNKTYGHWGGREGAPFTIPMQPGSAIVGFFARGATYLHAIGVYVRPL